MIEIHQLSKSFGASPVLASATARLSPGHRTGLVGPNGCGKTTLLRMIADEEPYDGGQIRIRRNHTVAYLPQNLEAIPGDTILDAVHRGEYPEYQAKRLLSGLGFKDGQFDRPIDEFSGGYRMRVALANLLIREPDVLLLDEPTNHLDVHTQAWFENFLQQAETTLLIVSHDVEFLNRMVDHVWEIFNNQLRTYTGNYSSYIKQRDAHRAQLEAQAKSQGRKIDKLNRFVDRFRSKATKASQVQSRLKELNKIKRVETERKQRGLQFNFPQPAASGQRILTLSHIAKRYGDNVVYEDLSLEINRGDRLALLGENGAGKSTLLKILAGVLPFDDGVRETGHNVSLHYFAQHQTEVLSGEHTIIESINEAQPDMDVQWIRSVAGAFLFSGDDQFKPINVLSGGEKSRVALARMLVKPANTLLLDEPTNHLDPGSVDVLTDALNAFAGTIVFISHDPVFLSRIANRCLEIEHGVATNYVGDYEYYLWKRSEELADDNVAASEKPQSKAPVSPSRNTERRELSKTVNRAERKVAKLEADVAKLEQEIAQCDEELRKEETYANYTLWQELEAKHSQLSEQLEQVMTDWQQELDVAQEARDALAAFDETSA